MPHDTTKGLFCVYKIFNSINDKLYIGVTTAGLRKRWIQHTSEARRHRDRIYVHRAMQKYGIEHFRMELVEICPDKDAMLERELYWISFYNTVSPYGYNSTHGGEHNGGRTFSEEHKRKLSEAGKKISEEGRAKISERSRAMWPTLILEKK